MTTLRLLLFIFFSFAEVHIYAKDFVTLPLVTNVATEPEDCVLKSSFCSVKTSVRQKYVLVFGESEVTLDENSIVVRETSDTIALVKGMILVKAKGLTKVKTEFGSVQGEDSEFMVSREGKKVVARAIYKSLVLFPKGSKEQLELESGFKNYLSGVGKNGEAQTGIPLVWDFDKMLNMRARLFSGHKQDFKRVAKDLHEVWEKAVGQASYRHQIYAGRYIAKVEEERKVEQLKRQKVLEQEKALRKMMTERNYLDLF